MMHKILLILLAGLLTACAARTSLPPMPEQALKAKRYQLQITAHDGETIAATLWQPSLPAGASAPLVLHTHGFGLSRMNGGVGLYENLLSSGQVAKRLWQEGFWLLTWDQRGHGNTGGIINVMDPDKEVRDVTTLLNWAEQNIPRLTRDNDGDIKVGMIGESYGGGVQLLAITQDSRIDAIVPMTTWHDLPESLAPGDVPKGGWVTVLYRMGDWWNFRKLHPTLRDNFSAARKGIINEELKTLYAPHALSHHCDGSWQTDVQVLLVQGFRDVLFNVNQALGNRDCLRAAGANVTLIAQTGGHLLPLEQFSASTPVWYRDAWLHCGSSKKRTDDVMAEWLSAQLTDRPAPELPSVCISTRGWGLALDEWPATQDGVPLPPATLSGKRSGSWRWLTGTADWLAGWRTKQSLARRYAQSRDGRLRPAILPLQPASGVTTLVGTPELLLEADTDIPVLAGLGVRRAGSARFRLAHEQMTAAHAGQITRLPPVALRLEPGDQLAVLLFSRHPQFNTLPMNFGNGTIFGGQIRLPGLQEREARQTADTRP